MNKRLRLIYITFLIILFIPISPLVVKADSFTIFPDHLSERSLFSTTKSIDAVDAPNSYAMIRDSLLNADEKGQFDPSEISNLDLEDFIIQITRDNPEIMYYNGAETWPNGYIDYKYSVPIEIVKSNQIQLQSEVNNVLTTIIKPGFSDFDKIKAIHDYIALNTAYDYDNFLTNTVSPHSYTAYGTLINGIAVCDGYTKAAQILLNRLGIENEYVVGYGWGQDLVKVLHSWNLVKLDGDYYFMDITWDDPVPDRPNYVGYTYFLVTSDQLSTDHDWVKENWPTATSDRFNFFSDAYDLIETGNYYYYLSLSNNFNLYKINKDGTNKQQVNEVRTRYFIIANDWIYFNDWDYANDTVNDDYLYKMKINGTDKQQINDVRAPYFAIAGDWIYFSNYSYGGYLFKMKTDGTQLEQLNDDHTVDIAIEGNTLIYYNHTTNERQTIVVSNEVPGTDLPKDPNDRDSDDNDPSIELIGKPVQANYPWKVTFSKKFNFSSITKETVYIQDHEGNIIVPTYEADTTGTVLTVIPPADGYAKNTNYTLVIENVKSENNETQGKKATQQFYVQP